MILREKMIQHFLELHRKGLLAGLLRRAVPGLSEREIASDRFAATVIKRGGFYGRVRPTGHWRAVCHGPDGAEKWAVEWDNIVVNAGLNYLLDVALSAATQLTTWYVGLVNGATPTFAAADTMASHAGWTENTNYTQANRVTWVDAGASGNSITNSASPAAFGINTNGQTLGGAFLTSNNTKGGTTGTLYAEGDFSPDKTADNGDTLSVTGTFTSADDGV